MKKYLITVNGNQYEVEVEELNNNRTVVGQVKKTQGAVKASNPDIMVPDKVKKNTADVRAAGKHEVKAPMPGTVLKVNVKEGDIIKKGQIILVLEAMKMENEIASPVDGKVAALNTKNGKMVNSGDVLAVLEESVN